MMSVRCSSLRGSPTAAQASPRGDRLTVVMEPDPFGRLENPYVRMLADGLVERGVDVVAWDRRAILKATSVVIHLHWPESVLWQRSTWRALRKALAQLVGLTVVRLKGGAVVWTMHNLLPHDTGRPLMSRLVFLLVARMVTATISLTSSGAELATSTYRALGRKPMAVIPHGRYADQLRELPPPPRSETTAATFLFVGRLRPYKGIDALLAAFEDLPGDHYRLVVAGKPADDRIVHELQGACLRDPRIHAEARHLDDGEITRLLSAADVVVLPYKRILNSGAAILALSANRPVLVPDTPAMIELAELTGHGWVQTFRGELTAEQLAQTACSRPTGTPDMSWAEWAGIAQSTEDLYRRALNVRPGSGRARAHDGAATPQTTGRGAHSGHRTR